MTVGLVQLRDRARKQFWLQIAIRLGLVLFLIVLTWLGIDGTLWGFAIVLSAILFWALPLIFFVTCPKCGESLGSSAAHRLRGDQALPEEMRSCPHCAEQLW